MILGFHRNLLRFVWVWSRVGDWDLDLIMVLFFWLILVFWVVFGVLVDIYWDFWRYESRVEWFWVVLLWFLGWSKWWVCVDFVGVCPKGSVEWELPKIEYFLVWGMVWVMVSSLILWRVSRVELLWVTQQIWINF